MDGERETITTGIAAISDTASRSAARTNRASRKARRRRRSRSAGRPRQETVKNLWLVTQRKPLESVEPIPWLGRNQEIPYSLAAANLLGSKPSARPSPPSAKGDHYHEKAPSHCSPDCAIHDRPRLLGSDLQPCSRRQGRPRPRRVGR